MSDKSKKAAAPAAATPAAAPAVAAATPVAAAPAAAPAADPKIKLLDEKLKELQVEEATLRVEKAKADKANAAAEATVKLDLSRTQLRAAQLDLEKKEREAARDKASADENLTYTFYDGVTDESIKPALAKLGDLSRRFPKQPMTIIVNSPGGSVLAGLALYDYVQKLRADGHHVTIMCLGMAASMGGILLQAGDRRVVGANSKVLIHAVSGGTIGTVHAMEDRVAFSRSLWENLKKILAVRSVLSEEEIEERAHRKDWWLDAQEAVDLGFADEIQAVPAFAGAKSAKSQRAPAKNKKKSAKDLKKKK